MAGDDVAMALRRKGNMAMTMAWRGYSDDIMKRTGYENNDVMKRQLH
jgi:energy-coupling factor transporter transmembrane protein EcfT